MNGNWWEPALVVSVAVLLSSVIFGCIRIHKLNCQLHQIAESNLVRAGIENNWKLYDHWKAGELPCFLPSWEGLSVEKFAWRVVLLNHLNLLKQAYDDLGERRVRRSTFDEWVTMGKYWFSGLRDPSTPSRREGLSVLEALLAEEIYPERFVDRLRHEGVLPAEA